MPRRRGRRGKRIQQQVVTPDPAEGTLLDGIEDMRGKKKGLPFVKSRPDLIEGLEGMTGTGKGADFVPSGAVPGQPPPGMFSKVGRPGIISKADLELARNPPDLLNALAEMTGAGGGLKKSAGVAGEIASTAKTGKRISSLAELKGGVSPVVAKYLGRNFPASATGVQNFMKSLRVISNVDEIPVPIAQRIANKLHAIPAASAKTMLEQTATGVIQTVKNAGKSTPILKSLMGFFEIGGSESALVGSNVLSAGRTAYRAVKGAASTGLGLATLFTGAYELRRLRDIREERKAIAQQRAVAPSAEDMVNEGLLDELRTRSRLRSAGGTGVNPSGAGLEALLSGGEQENPLESVSIPPSSGFPTGR